MIHSLYSHKDIFLRELISNASDALDKAALRGAEPTGADAGAASSKITLEVDADARTLSVHDNGIGMTRDEVVAEPRHHRALGHPRVPPRRARGESRERRPSSSGSSASASTRLHGRRPHHRASRGAPAERGHALGVDRRRRLHPRARPSGPRPGTTVTLHLKPEDEEDGLEDYTAGVGAQGHRQALLRLRLLPDPPRGRDAQLDEGDLGARQGRGHRGGAPRVLPAHQPRLERPARAPERAHRGRRRGARAPLHPVQGAVRPLHRDGGDRGLSLYVKRVFIMDDWRELCRRTSASCAASCRSDDLSLNVSREILQKDRQVQAIRKQLVRRSSPRSRR